jgi:hypothetical protein
MRGYLRDEKRSALLFFADLNDRAGGEHYALTHNEARIREWLFLLLRFAITRVRKDCAAAIQKADEMDAAGLYWRPSGPTFFVRTTQEICAAIIAADDQEQQTVLKKHTARIEEPRLRLAWQAVLELNCSSRPETVQGRRKARVIDLWKGVNSS